MLTDTAVKAAKATEKPYKLYDERGLYLLVSPAGSRLWRFKYVHGKREKLLALGQYPDVSLKDARDRRDAARKQVAAGIDPSAAKQAEKAARDTTLRGVAEELLESLAGSLESATVERIRDRLTRWAFNKLGGEPLDGIKAPQVLMILRRVEAAGRGETARRLRADLSRVFRYGVATGRCERDPTADLRGALVPVKVRSFAAVTEPAKVGQMLRDIDHYSGQPVTQFALKLAPLLFVRPGELRQAEWAEFELGGKEPAWRIPSARMKMREAHVVPLARQAVELLEGLDVLTGTGRLLFPTLHDPNRPMSNNTLNVALRRLGYSKDEATAHGFRSMASTLLNELGFAPDIIELQLAHKDQSVRAIYNRSSRLAERRKMMQAWADYLDGLKAGGKIVPIKKKA